MKHYSFSEIDTWNRCPMKWFYAYSERLESLTKSDPLQTGSLVHKCLQAFYTANPKNRSYRLMESVLNQSIDNVSKDVMDKCRRYIKRYWATYGSDDDIIAECTEKRFVATINDIKFVYVPDAIITINDEHFLMEYKTGKPDLPSLVFDNIQIPFYIYLFNHSSEFLWPEPITGCIYNLLHESEEFERESIIYTTHELYHAWDEMRDSVNAIIENVIYRKRSFLCKSCNYVHLCRAEIQGLDIDYVKENLYKTREKRNE